MPALCNVDGRIGPAEEAVVPVLDRGFLYGDSVYEVFRTYGGKPFELERHLLRMQRSAERLGLSLPAREHMLSEVDRTLRAAGNPESYVRIVVTRGVGRFGLSPHLAQGEHRLVLLVRPLEPYPAELYERGLSMAVVRIRRNPPQALDPALKTGNYLNNVLALAEAHDADADDAILLDLQGRVTEASTSNVFFAQGGVLVTPPLQLGLLEGITRGVLLEVARGEGLRVQEEPVGAEALALADEVFVTSTLREVLAVTSLVFPDAPADRRRRAIAGGAPGPLTRRLRQAFRARVQRTHPA